MKTAAVTVTLVLAIAALAAAAEDNVKPAELLDGKPAEFNPVMDLTLELQAKIQAAQDLLSRYPDWCPLGARELLMVNDIAVQLEAARRSVGSIKYTDVTIEIGMGMGMSNVGEAIDVLDAMNTLAHELAHTIQQGTAQAETAEY